MPFEFVKQEIPDVLLIKPKVFEDERGFFFEMYKSSDFKSHIPFDFVQENYSFSKKGVIRGLHYQKNPYEQGKLVSCIKGSIFDVVIDIRKNSPTYGKFITAILSEKNKYLLWIPPGFAHGFLALEDSVVLYSCTKEYVSQSEASIIWNDSDIAINWPITNPILSQKDALAPNLKESEK